MKKLTYNLEGMALWEDLVRAGVSVDERGFVTNNSPVMNPKPGGFDIVNGIVGYKQDFFLNLSFDNEDIVYRAVRRFNRNGDK